MYFLLGLVEFGSVGFEVWNSDLVRQVVLDSVRQNEVTVGETLHEGRCAEAVSTVVGEVAFAYCEQAFHSSLKFVVNPDAAHCVVDGRIYHHGVVIFLVANLASQFARVYIGDFLIHIEEVAVALAHNVEAQAFDTFGEVEEHGKAGVVHAVALVAAFLGCTRGNVARNEVTECRVAAFQVVVAVFFGNVAAFLAAFLQCLGIFELFGNPDAAVVTQRFRHKGKFRLLVAVYGDTSGVDLHESRVGEESSLAVAGHCRATVAGHGVGRKEVGVAISAGGYHHCVCGKAFELAGNEVAGNDTASAAIDDYHVVHFVAVVALHLAHLYLAVERRVCAQQQLLPRLAFCVESTRHLCATE